MGVESPEIAGPFSCIYFPFDYFLRIGRQFVSSCSKTGHDYFFSDIFLMLPRPPLVTRTRSRAIQFRNSRVTDTTSSSGQPTHPPPSLRATNPCPTSTRHPATRGTTHPRDTTSTKRTSTTNLLRSTCLHQLQTSHPDIRCANCRVVCLEIRILNENKKKAIKNRKFL